MTDSDQFLHFDGAYVLDALSHAEREAFEEHLIICDDCRARVAEIALVPSLLADLTAADFHPDPDPVPETLLPRLLRAADRQRRRSRLLVTGLGLVAAACIAALVIVLAWPGSSSRTPEGFRDMHAISKTVPVAAKVRLVATDSGTEVDVHCVYNETAGHKSPPYGLVVYRKGSAKPQYLGWWTLTAGHEETFVNNSSWQPGDITKVALELGDGREILSLNV